MWACGHVGMWEIPLGSETDPREFRSGPPVHWLAVVALLVGGSLPSVTSVASAQLQVDWTTTWGAGTDEVVFWGGIDGGGDVHLTGQRYNNNGNAIDLVSLGYDSNGTLLYAKDLAAGPGAAVEGSFVDAAGLLTASGETGAPVGLYMPEIPHIMDL